MKKYIVIWRPKAGGKTAFRSEVTAPDALTAPALVGIPAQGELVSVAEYVQDLWTPIAAPLCAHLEQLEVKRKIGRWD